MDTNIVIVLVVSVIAIIAAVLITAKVTTNRLKKNCLLYTSPSPRD